MKNLEKIEKFLVAKNCKNIEFGWEDAGDAILDKFESDCMNAPNFAEGLRIAFDNLPDNFLK